MLQLLGSLFLGLELGSDAAGTSWQRQRSRACCCPGLAGWDAVLHALSKSLRVKCISHRQANLICLLTSPHKRLSHDYLGSVLCNQRLLCKSA